MIDGVYLTEKTNKKVKNMNYKSYGKIIILTALIIAFIESIMLLASAVYYGSEISIFYLIFVLIGFIVSIIKTSIAGIIFAIIAPERYKLVIFLSITFEVFEPFIGDLFRHEGLQEYESILNKIVDILINIFAYWVGNINLKAIRK